MITNYEVKTVSISYEDLGIEPLMKLNLSFTSDKIKIHETGDILFVKIPDAPISKMIEFRDKLNEFFKEKGIE